MWPITWFKDNFEILIIIIIIIFLLESKLLIYLLTIQLTNTSIKTSKHDEKLAVKIDPLIKTA